MHHPRNRLGAPLEVNDPNQPRTAGPPPWSASAARRIRQPRTNRARPLKRRRDHRRLSRWDHHQANQPQNREDGSRDLRPKRGDPSHKPTPVPCHQHHPTPTLKRLERLKPRRRTRQNPQLQDSACDESGAASRTKTSAPDTDRNRQPVQIHARVRSRLTPPNARSRGNPHAAAIAPDGDGHEIQRNSSRRSDHVRHRLERRFRSRPRTNAIATIPLEPKIPRDAASATEHVRKPETAKSRRRPDQNRSRLARHEGPKPDHVDQNRIHSQTVPTPNRALGPIQTDHAPHQNQHPTAHPADQTRSRVSDPKQRSGDRVPIRTARDITGQITDPGPRARLEPIASRHRITTFRPIPRTRTDRLSDAFTHLKASRSI